LFENQIVNDENLIIPHPQMHNRRFTLIPANEIGTGIVHPVLGQTISQLLDNCNDSGEVVLVEKPN
jgi:2-amino-4-hydroxy-6-hydroxymethyldihydropteridine diphosphokinase